MARKEAIKQQRQERAVIIGAGLTERWYFSHLQSRFNLKIKIRPRFFGNRRSQTMPAPAADRPGAAGASRTTR